jgi:medium-chain acyl-[acyl-carrier-protein] hydrolase
LHLFLSARGASDSPQRSTPIHDLPEPALIQAIAERYRPIPEVILKEPDLLALTLPALRADLEILARHRYTEVGPLDVPLTIFGGSSDRVVEREDLDRWAAHGSRVDVEIVKGDHFFIEEPAIISGMAATIRAKLRAQ